MKEENFKQKETGAQDRRQRQTFQIHFLFHSFSLFKCKTRSVDHLDSTAIRAYNRVTGSARSTSELRDFSPASSRRLREGTRENRG